MCSELVLCEKFSELEAVSCRVQVLAIVLARYGWPKLMSAGGVGAAQDALAWRSRRRQLWSAAFNTRGVPSGKIGVMGVGAPAPAAPTRPTRLGW